ncbi:MAG: hypothetical protein AAB597_02800 [Patescibacteria group bacterium]
MSRSLKDLCLRLKRVALTNRLREHKLSLNVGSLKDGEVETQFGKFVNAANYIDVLGSELSILEMAQGALYLRAVRGEAGTPKGCYAVYRCQSNEYPDYPKSDFYLGRFESPTYETFEALEKKFFCNIKR